MCMYIYTRICIQIYIYRGLIHPSPLHSQVGLYTILPLTIVYGMYCNTGWSRGDIILRNNVCDEGGMWGAHTKVVFAKNNMDSFTYVSK